MKVRNYCYKAIIQTPDKKKLYTFGYEDPNAVLDIKFNVTRNVGANNNRLTLDIYNLTPEKQYNLFKPLIRQSSEASLTQQNIITLFGGRELDDRKFYYNVIFKGQILKTTPPRREGADTVITIVAEDGMLGLGLSYVALNFDANTQPLEVYRALINQVKNKSIYLEEGRTDATSFETLENSLLSANETKYGILIDGNLQDALNKLTGNRILFNNGKIEYLGSDAVWKGGVYGVKKLDGDNHLVNSLTLDDGAVIANAELDFMPQISILGEYININSTLEKGFNGTWKVVGVTHQGNISQTQGSMVTTIVRLYINDRTGLFRQI